MMPTPAATVLPVAVPDSVDVAGVALAHDIMEQHTRRTSTDGDPYSRHSAGSSGSDDSESMGEYSDASNSSDDDDLSDEESLAERRARGYGKRSASSHDQGQPAKRRRSSSDSGGSVGEGNSSRKRRNLFPAIRRSQRCGTCHTCQNPQLKKACMTVREKMMKEMQGGSSSGSRSQRSAKQSASSAAAATQQVLSPTGSADLDQDKYVALLEPLINSAGGLRDTATVEAFIQSMDSYKTTTSRILPTTVLSNSAPHVLSAFMTAGGVDRLGSWMLEAEGEDTDHAKTLLVDCLRLLQKLPVTQAFVSSTRSARVVGSLRKCRDKEVAQLASQVVKLWMRVIPQGSKGSSAAAKPAGSVAKAAGASGAASAAAVAKKPAQSAAAATNGAVARTGSGPQMVSDNDLFKPAAAARPKTSLRTGMGQPKRTGGVQLVDTAEAGKLLAGSAATNRSQSAAAAAAGAKLLPSQRPRLPSPPLTGSTAAAAGSSAAAGQSRLVAVEVTVTPEQAVTVTLRVTQPAAGQGRLQGLRRGFGSSLGGQRQLSGAVPSAVAAAVSGAAYNAAAGGSEAAAAAAAAAAGSERKPRKPRKRVTWKSERELESVRWFIKEDPAVKAREDAHLTDEQLRALAAQRHPHSDFHNLIMMEHQHEKIALEAHHREEEERRRAALATMQPGCPWHGTPPFLQLDTEWQVAFGEDSTESKRVTQPLPDMLLRMQYAQFMQPEESMELLKPPPSTFNMAHHDPNVKLIPLFGVQQQLQQQQPAQVVVQPGPPVGTFQLQPLQQPFPGKPIVAQQQHPQQPPAPQLVQQPVTYTLGQGALPSQPQLVMQPLQQQQHQQQPAASGPPSSSENLNLMQVLQSLSQSGVFQQPQQQQQQQQQQAPPQPVVSQMQLPQQPVSAQLLQPPAAPVQLPPGAPPGHVVIMDGEHVLMPSAAAHMGPNQPPLQLPPGFQLAPQHQQTPGGPPVIVFAGQPGIPLSGPPSGPLDGVPLSGPPHGPPHGPPPGPWGGPPPHGPPPHGPPPPHGGPPPLGGPSHRGGPSPHGHPPPHGPPFGAGGPQRHGGRGGRGGGGPYHREGGAPWKSSGRVCKFFTTAKGCSKGDGCDFRHVLPGSDVDVREGR